MRFKALILSSALLLTACASTQHALQEGKTNFEQQHYTVAFQQLQPLAKQGNSDAQYAVGYMYYYGKGTAKDIEQAKLWIKKAAAQGQPQAVTALDMLNKPVPLSMGVSR